MVFSEEENVPRHSSARSPKGFLVKKRLADLRGERVLLIQIPVETLLRILRATAELMAPLSRRRTQKARPD